MKDDIENLLTMTAIIYNEILVICSEWQIL